MYNPKDVQFAGKHDYEKPLYLGGYETFSVGIFKWVLKSNGKSMKKSKALVRVKGFVINKEHVFSACEEIVKDLDSNMWDGRKYVTLK